MLLLSTFAGAGTLLGASLALLLLPSRQAMPFLFGIAAGVMSSMVALELLPTAGTLGTPGSTFLGCFSGITLLFLIDLLLTRYPLAYQEFRRLGWLLFIAIALHDFPEGVALGSGGATKADLGILLSLTLGIHNIPEGIINAAPLRYSGLSAKSLLLLNLLLSLVTPLGTFFGLLLARWAPYLVPGLLALAAGAMLYVVFKELLPRCAGKGGRAGLVTGFALTYLIWRLLGLP